MIIDDYAFYIKELRKRMLVSQVELANILGVSFASVNRWEMDYMNQLLKLKENLENFL